ncbi:hypothetical protein QFZ22_008271 [Streptomyces canus]|uniref:Uncharacterized protein n=1 Tax=Streptomyces canus TaxID=58343 RepID=A0AAW8FQD3_9ACTN|nr:hypothetical protein [Streptomyces canus]MDQ0912286.1 hypothetical protein [Streptomyces canus]
MEAHHRERNGQRETLPRRGLLDAAVAHQDGVRGRHVERQPTVPPLAGVTPRPAASVRVTVSDDQPDSSIRPPRPGCVS